jgi:hypothetical protein
METLADCLPKARNDMVVTFGLRPGMVKRV